VDLVAALAQAVPVAAVVQAVAALAVHQVVADVVAKHAILSFTHCIINLTKI
jgi:hypothetical protein